MLSFQGALENSELTASPVRFRSGREILTGQTIATAGLQPGCRRIESSPALPLGDSVRANAQTQACAAPNVFRVKELIKLLIWPRMRSDSPFRKSGERVSDPGPLVHD